MDARIDYDDKSHRYWFDGKLAPISVTTALKKAFNPNDEFDTDGTIARWFDKWVREGPKNEYYSILKKFTNGFITKEQAVQEIKDVWATAGPFGTELHRLIEIFLNQLAAEQHASFESITTQYEKELTKEVLVEFKQFLDWWQTWAAPRGLLPYRTELSVVWLGEKGQLVCAGQIDGLFVDKEGVFWIIDWKRVKPKKLLTVFERAFRDPITKLPNTAQMFSEIPMTDFHKYSFQQSMYSVMLLQTHGISTGPLRLLRMHKDLGEAQFIECADYRAQAKTLLAALEQE